MKQSFLERLFWVTGWAYDFSKVATILLVIGLIVHYFFFSVLVVRGRSMEPNYNDGNVLLVNKLAYITSQPKRGDVVAMFFPGETQKHFIKRVVGLPGEEVAAKDGQLYINGKQLPESYLPKDLQTLPDFDRTLPTGEYMVLGDNRSVSSDSRAWGPVPRSFIVGRINGWLFNVPSQLPSAS